MEIKGYTLHGRFYLADKVIPNKSWKEALKMEEEVTLPNGKTVVAHTLSKAELETIPRKERIISENGHWWYWTSTPSNSNIAWNVSIDGVLLTFTNNPDDGGARLGFKNPFIES